MDPAGSLLRKVLMKLEKITTTSKEMAVTGLAFEMLIGLWLKERSSTYKDSRNWDSELIDKKYQKPNAEELNQLRKALAIMTPTEKRAAAELTDEQVERIAADAQVDAANLAIFINGYALHCKKVS